jgi:hypothetical protein
VACFSWRALLPTCPAVTAVRQLVLQFRQHKS